MKKVLFVLLVLFLFVSCQSVKGNYVFTTDKKTSFVVLNDETIIKGLVDSDREYETAAIYRKGKTWFIMDGERKIEIVIKNGVYSFPGYMED